jgi:hypothetical protein
MKLTFHLPNPRNAEMNQEVFQTLAGAVGEFSVPMEFRDGEGGSYSGRATLTAVEGDNYDEKEES